MLQSFDFDTVFDELLTRPTGSRGRTGWPSVEGNVEDGALHVRCDLPGVDPKDVQVSLEDGTLTISGERKIRPDTAAGAYTEIRYGRFERRLTVPEGLDPERVTAHCENGVLDVVLPLPAARLPRRIPIAIEEPAAKAA